MYRAMEYNHTFITHGHIFWAILNFREKFIDYFQATKNVKLPSIVLRTLLMDRPNSHSFCRAIAFAWIVIVTSAIPVAVSHGVLNYPYRGQNYTACVFQSELGYSLVAFQVKKYIYNMFFVVVNVSMPAYELWTQSFMIIITYHMYAWMDYLRVIQTW